MMSIRHDGVQEIGWWHLSKKKKRNRLVFENEVTSAQRIKANFVTSLWTWANLYCVDNTNCVLDFLTWLRSR